MTTNDLTNARQYESSVEYLNQFKEVIVSDDTKLTESVPIRIELNKIILSKYKIFDNYEEFGKTFEFDLNGPLITIVGPNCSGKTALLEAVQFFCRAIKNGSGCYSSKEAKQLYGIAQESRVLIKGIFKVYYQNINNIKDLELEVLLVPDQFKCDKRETCVKLPNTNERFIHVYVTMPLAKTQFSQWSDLCQFCPKDSNNLFIRDSDYGIFADLFPQVIILNRKNVLNCYLRDLSDKIPNITQHRQEIDDEIRRIFPFVHISSTKGIVNIETSNLDKKSIPILIDRDNRVYPLGYSENEIEDVAPLSEGLVQCLLIITTVCCTQGNSIIIIDEPDAHVFPTAQKALMEFFYRKIESFRRLNSFYKILITTHSPDIMQSVKLEDIRQIFVDSQNGRPIVIRSLDSIGQLYNVLMDIGASFLTHGELVRLGVHRKLLYLEGDDDFEFLSGIISKMEPDLLSFPFTRIVRGGRATPSQIEDIIKEFQKYLPKENVLHVFVLVDSDLLLKEVLEIEKKAYCDIENNTNLNVRIYYYYWAVREWENWLLYNENLLYEMLCGNELYRNDPLIKQLRDQIQQHRQSDIMFHSQNTTTSNFVDKSLFDNWFSEELKRHFEILEKQLTLPQMRAIEINERNSKEIARQYYTQYLQEKNITDDMTQFGHLADAIRVYIGELIQKQQTPKRNLPKNNPNKASEELEKSRTLWLFERKLQQPIDFHQIASRNELTQWIDAKLFFHQLTNGKDNNSKKRGLDKFWRQAFSQTISGINNLYGRFFNSLHPQKYPTDFEDLLTKFKQFITAK